MYYHKGVRRGLACANMGTPFLLLMRHLDWLVDAKTTVMDFGNLH